VADAQAPEASRWVHVGDAYLYVDAPGRLAEKPAPSKEAVNGEELAAALSELRREPDGALAILEGFAGDAEAATQSVEELVDLARKLADITDPAVAANLAEPILARIVRDYRDSRFRDVVRLASAVLSIYLVYEKWRTLVALLHLDHLAAEAVGDAAEAARALADLGALAKATGNAPLVGELYEQARDLFEQAGDHVAGEAAGRAGTAVPQVAAHTGVAVGAKVAAAVVGAVVLAGAATGLVVGNGVWFNVGGDDSEQVQQGGDAKLVAFATRADATDAGTEDARSGWSPSADAVPPGGELQVCEPLFLYAFVDFVGMAPGTRWSVDASNGGRPFASDSGSWAAGSRYTMRLTASSNAPVIPYGAWTFVARIGDQEVDRGEVTLVEAC
jgi:hypothetical protein